MPLQADLVGHSQGGGVLPDYCLKVLGGADYSEYDEAVTPFTRQIYSGAGVRNIHFQDGCAEDLSEHIATMYSERTWLHVRNALAPNRAEPVPCFPVAPFWPGVH